MKYIIKKKSDAAYHFSIDYQKELTEEQFQVVTSDGGPTLVIAGAGSGKTRTVTYRVAYLLEKGIPPPKILLVTFTNKAAAEMLHRVEALIKRDIRQIWGGTFHHIGNMILRRHARLLGYQENFLILDDEDSKDLIKICINELGYNRKERRFPQADVLQDIISYSINARSPIEEVIFRKNPSFADLISEIKKIAAQYDQRKKKQNLMDFDDLLVNWQKILENEKIRDLYANKFWHILVDEYQDTNIIQAEIVDELSQKHRNLMVVGDDSQSIYSFRGAHFKNIINFPERWSGCKIFKLQINHRSTPEILSLANSIIVNAKEHFEKELVSRRREGLKPVKTALSDVYEQANFVSQRILELYDQGINLNDIAVLYRSHYHCLELQLEFTKRGIPFYVRSGLRFFEQAHIKDVAAHLKIIQNPTDEISWKRILNIIRGVGSATSDKIWKQIILNKDILSFLSSKEIEKIIPQRAKNDWENFTATINSLNSVKEPAEMIKVVLSSGYRDYLEANYPNYEARIEDINQLSNYSLKYPTLEKFLSEMALIGGLTAEDIIYDQGDKEGSVILTTIHQAKGLEWKVVFVIWLADGRFPSAKTFADSDAFEEERRLFYVAVTRAKDEVYLTYPLISSSYNGAGEVIFKPSRFLQELDMTAIEQWEVEEEEETEEEDGDSF